MEGDEKSDEKLNFSGKNSREEGKTVLDVLQRSFILICIKLAYVNELRCCFLKNQLHYNKGNYYGLLERYTVGDCICINRVPSTQRIPENLHIMAANGRETLKSGGKSAYSYLCTYT
jgi:hypothetical protein